VAVPTISVVIPARDSARHIGRCLDAVLAQESERLEVIVVEHGSTDGTDDVVRGYPDVQLFHTDIPGIAAGRNRGVAAAVAPLIAFCDSDDEWLPGKAHRQAEHLRARPDLAAVLCEQEIALDGVERPSWVALDHRGRYGVMPTSGIYRAEVFAEVGGFVESPTGQANDDFDLLVRMREHGLRMEILDEELMRRHVHDANYTHRTGGYGPGVIEALRGHVRRTRA